MQTKTAKILGMCSIISAFLLFPNLSSSYVELIPTTIEKEIPTEIVFIRPQIEPKSGTIDISLKSNTEVECLTRAIYYEARDQSTKGKYAVADVTLNRTESELFPHSVCKVIKQPGQFSWYRNGKHRYKNFEEDWSEAKEVAKYAVKHRNTVVPKSALYFHADYVHPKWSRKLKKVAHIEDHVFYASKK